MHVELKTQYSSSWITSVATLVFLTDNCSVAKRQNITQVIIIRCSVACSFFKLWKMVRSILAHCFMATHTIMGFKGHFYTYLISGQVSVVFDSTDVLSGVLSSLFDLTNNPICQIERFSFKLKLRSSVYTNDLSTDFILKILLLMYRDRFGYFMMGRGRLGLRCPLLEVANHFVKWQIIRHDYGAKGKVPFLMDCNSNILFRIVSM